MNGFFGYPHEVISLHPYPDPMLDLRYMNTGLITLWVAVESQYKICLWWSPFCSDKELNTNDKGQMEICHPCCWCLVTKLCLTLVTPKSGRSLWTSLPSSRVTFATLFRQLYMPSQYSTDSSSPVSPYEPLFSWCHHQQILVSITWETPLDLPCPSAAHVSTTTAFMYLQICPPYVILAATLP